MKNGEGRLEVPTDTGGVKQRAQNSVNSWTQHAFPVIQILIIFFFNLLRMGMWFPLNIPYTVESMIMQIPQFCRKNNFPGKIYFKKFNSVNSACRKDLETVPAAHRYWRKFTKPIVGVRWQAVEMIFIFPTFQLLPPECRRCVEKLWLELEIAIY